MICTVSTVLFNILFNLFMTSKNIPFAAFFSQTLLPGSGSHRQFSQKYSEQLVSSGKRKNIYTQHLAIRIFVHGIRQSVF